MSNVAERINDLLEKYNQTKKETQMSNQANVLKNVTERNFIVGIINCAGTVSVSMNPVYHEYEPAAVVEAKRLASLNPGTAYMVLQLKSAFVATGFTTY